MISKSGNALVHVWPNESSSRRCFTGVELLTGDCSCLWLREHFERTNLFKIARLRQYRRLLRDIRRTNTREVCQHCGLPIKHGEGHHCEDAVGDRRVA